MKHILFVFNLSLSLMFACSNLCYASTLPAVHKIMIYKKSKKMKVYHNDKLIHVYKIALGFSPIGHKVQAGDGKTPEGKYYIHSKNPNSRFYKSLKISYPNTQDKLNAYHAGVSPGGDIMIHGLGKKNGWIGKLHTASDWTLGCVAVTNEEMAEIYQATSVGTIVEIFP